MYINKAFELVKWTHGQTGRNPAVGCVVVKNDKIVGIGAHLVEGEAHAEVNAINMAGKHAKGATLYCTLEPCSHFGKTPPCTQKIVNSGIKKVVFAARDITLHSGIQYMENSGVEVEHIDIPEINEFYRPFFKSKQTEIPYTIIKMGITLDGKTADDQNVSKWITNELSRQDVHYERYLCDAILVGYQTYVHDQPILDSREYKNKFIYKVVVTNGEFKVNDVDQNPYDLSRLIVISSIEQTVENANVYVVPDLNPLTILKKLYQLNINKLMVEGGMTTIRQFIKYNCYDEIHQYIAPKMLGGSSKHQFLTTDTPSKMNQISNLKLVSLDRFKDDVKLKYRKED